MFTKVIFLRNLGQVFFRNFCHILNLRHQITDNRL